MVPLDPSLVRYLQKTGNTFPAGRRLTDKRLLSRAKPQIVTTSKQITALPIATAHQRHDFLQEVFCNVQPTRPSCQTPTTKHIPPLSAPHGTFSPLYLLDRTSPKVRLALLQTFHPARQPVASGSFCAVIFGSLRRCE